MIINVLVGVICSANHIFYISSGLHAIRGLISIVIRWRTKRMQLKPWASLPGCHWTYRINQTMTRICQVSRDLEDVQRTVKLTGSLRDFLPIAEISGHWTFDMAWFYRVSGRLHHTGSIGICLNSQENFIDYQCWVLWSIQYNKYFDRNFNVQ